MPIVDPSHAIVYRVYVSEPVKRNPCFVTRIKEKAFELEIALLKGQHPQLHNPINGKSVAWITERYLEPPEHANLGEQEIHRMELQEDGTTRQIVDDIVANSTLD